MEQQAMRTERTASQIAPGGRAAPASAVDGGAVRLFAERVETSGPRAALRWKQAGAWHELTWSEWDGASREIAAGLMAAGINRGDRVCILSLTRHEWLLADLGILMAGAATVPIYQSDTPKECAYILEDSGAKAIFVEDPAQLEKLLHPEARGQALAAEPLIVIFDESVRFDKPDARGRLGLTLDQAAAGGDRARVRTLAELREEGRRWLAAQGGDPREAVDRRWRALGGEDLFTVVYTSGTTGNRKGVVLVHDNVVATVDGTRDVLPLGEGDEQLLFLPLAHIFAKVLEWGTIVQGSRIAFAESLGKLKDNLAEVRPTFMGAVPRVYEKFHAGIAQAVKDSPPPRRRLLEWALRVARETSREQQRGRPVGGLLGLQRDLAERLVIGKLKRKLGLDRVRFLVSGAAPLAKEIAELFHALGLPILEGYGLTETTAAGSLNRLERYRFGTVGVPVPGIEVRIAPEDGEILLRGRPIMRGYHGKPEETRAAIDAEGWFHTGDIGELDGAFLRITDRKKDLIVTAGGKKVPPQMIESRLKALSPLVSQVLVHGDQRRFISALVTVAEDHLARWAEQHGLQGDYAALTRSEALRQEIQAVVDRMNRELASYEQVKKFAILPRDFTQEAGELTPTLKVKRKVCTEKYRAILDGFYGG